MDWGTAALWLLRVRLALRAGARHEKLGVGKAYKWVDLAAALRYLMSMAVQIIIDGYNFIGKQKGLRGDIEGRREELIRLLARYQAVKGYSVTVVFDGERSGWPDEHGEIREGVHVVFSRHGESADLVISRMAQELGNACIVVSSDREVARATQRSGGVAITISEFERRLMAAFSRSNQEANRGDREEYSTGMTPKGGNPRRLSKEERKKRLRLNKL